MQDDGSEIINSAVSPVLSHIAITNCLPESGSKLILYQLPLTQWHSEIELYMEQVVNEVQDNNRESQVSLTSKASKKQEVVMRFRNVCSSETYL